MALDHRPKLSMKILKELEIGAAEASQRRVIPHACIINFVIRPLCRTVIGYSKKEGAEHRQGARDLARNSCRATASFSSKTEGKQWMG
jgi:hypothetical protein